MTIGSRRRVTAVAIGLALVPAFLLAGCGGGASPSADGPAAGDDAIAVTLKEWGLEAKPDRADAGEVTFQVTNDGPDQVHDLVVIRTQLNPVDLPVTLTGQVDITAPGITVVAELDDIPVGETRELKATLEAGPYVLVCNDYTVSPQEAHYEMGMRVPFPVD